MAFPDPLRILTLDQSIFDVEGAVAMTWKHIPIYDLSTYRNLFPDQQVIPSIGSQTLALGAGDTAINVTTLQEPGPVSPVTNTYVDGAASNTVTKVTVVDDSVAAVEPRPWEKIVTLVEFWDAATVGQAIAALSVTLTSGSATVTVPDNHLLTPGQAIAGTGIPLGSIILRLSVSDQTVAVISQNATSNGAQTAALTGANRIAYYFAPEAIGGAPGCRILT
jgi:hypothetical protein